MGKQQEDPAVPTNLQVCITQLKESLPSEQLEEIKQMTLEEFRASQGSGERGERKVCDAGGQPEETGGRHDAAVYELA
ncbi:hypothetical protein ACFL01_04705 [Planctomycetota bacterium]